MESCLLDAAALAAAQDVINGVFWPACVLGVLGGCLLMMLISLAWSLRPVRTRDVEEFYGS